MSHNFCNLFDGDKACKVGYFECLAERANKLAECNWMKRIHKRTETIVDVTLDVRVECNSPDFIATLMQKRRIFNIRNKRLFKAQQSSVNPCLPISFIEIVVLHEFVAVFVSVANGITSWSTFKRWFKTVSVESAIFWNLS